VAARFNPGRALPERDNTRINERIRVPEVRLISDDGEQLGVVSREEALKQAQDKDLDLVEVAPNSKPPVCKILNYSKYKYQQAQKEKQARKHQQQITVREVKFRPKIAEQDYETKKNHVKRFLNRGDKVKVTVTFRGREITHPELGEVILQRISEALEDVCTIDQPPTREGRSMAMLLAPK